MHESHRTAIALLTAYIEVGEKLPSNAQFENFNVQECIADAREFRNEIRNNLHGDLTFLIPELIRSLNGMSDRYLWCRNERI